MALSQSDKSSCTTAIGANYSAWDTWGSQRWWDPADRSQLSWTRRRRINWASVDIDSTGWNASLPSAWPCLPSASSLSSFSGGRMWKWSCFIGSALCVRPPKYASRWWFLPQSITACSVVNLTQSGQFWRTLTFKCTWRMSSARLSSAISSTRKSSTCGMTAPSGSSDSGKHSLDTEFLLERILHSSSEIIRL